uniref:Uncharacterized protein n=1 Tax=Meloidogyne javanica TaxID=6303 RepID=A0A915MD16_MELJA
MSWSLFSGMGMREPAAPTMAPSAGVQQQSNSSNNSASAAAAAAAAAQNMEFMATVQNKDLLEELKVQSQAIVHKTITNGTPDGRQQMIRHYRCNRHRHQEKCPFKMLAIQSDDGTFKGQRVTVHKTTFHGKNRHFRCNRHRHNERCILAVTENNGTINVFRSGEHNHPIQQISNCVY